MLFTFLAKVSSTVFYDRKTIRIIGINGKEEHSVGFGIGIRS